MSLKYLGLSTNSSYTEEHDLATTAQWTRILKLLSWQSNPMKLPTIQSKRSRNSYLYTFEDLHGSKIWATFNFESTVPRKCFPTLNSLLVCVSDRPVFLQCPIALNGICYLKFWWYAVSHGEQLNARSNTPDCCMISIWFYSSCLILACIFVCEKFCVPEGMLVGDTQKEGFWTSFMEGWIMQLVEDILSRKVEFVPIATHVSSYIYFTYSVINSCTSAQ